MSIVLTMTRAFRQYPICHGSIGLKWLGSVHSIIRVMWILLCRTIYSNKYKYWSQTINLSIVITFFSSLSKTHNWHHNCHNHGRRRRKSPLLPHMRQALRFAPMLWMDGWQPPKLGDIILGGVEDVYGPQSAPLFRQWCITTTLECFEGHTHP